MQIAASHYCNNIKFHLYQKKTKKKMYYIYSLYYNKIVLVKYIQIEAL